MSAVAADSLTEGQQEALKSLRSIAQASDGALTVDLDYQGLDGTPDRPRLPRRPPTLLSSEQGIKLEDWEPIDILIPKDFPYSAADRLGRPQ